MAKIMPTIEKHIHKYYATQLGGERIIWENGKKKLVKVPGYPIMRCAIPECPHYLPTSNVLGMKTICWRCGEEMIIKAYHLREVKPHHRECRRKKEENTDAID